MFLFLSHVQNHTLSVPVSTDSQRVCLHVCCQAALWGDISANRFNSITVIVSHHSDCIPMIEKTIGTEDSGENYILIRFLFTVMKGVNEKVDAN